MSKILNELSPEDFGKSFDEEVFNNWKKSMNEHEQASVIMMVLFCAGLAAMLLLGGVVGLGLFFVLAFIGLGMTWPKLSKRKEYQRQLGISMKELRDAVSSAKKRV